MASTGAAPSPPSDDASPSGADTRFDSAVGPDAREVERWTDRYFLKTKRTIALWRQNRLLRRVHAAPGDLHPKADGRVAGPRGERARRSLPNRSQPPRGRLGRRGEPLLYITGSFHQLVDLETLYLQKLGAAYVAAYNAFTMCTDLPKVAFLAMDARHCAGIEMAELMAYAASVGSAAAKRQSNAVGFVGNANDATAHYFGRRHGLGTMLHALIGYAGSTVRAAEMFAETFPGEDLTVLVDYYGREVTDALAVCRRFPEMAAAGRLAIRLDTHGDRFIEGLDPQQSYAVLERHTPVAIRRYRNDTELRYLTGTGVSAAAIFHARERLDSAGFDRVKIVASSGFNVEKCKVMANVGAPIDAIGTGSHLPDTWRETYATADIVEYDGVPSVKVGREFLLKRRSVP